MAVQLRGHHLLCVLSYIGKGYNASFVDNYDQVVSRINDGEAIHIVSGPDDICSPLLCDSQAHCYQHDIEARDRLALDSVKTVLGPVIRPGGQFWMTEARIVQLRAAFADHAIRQACRGCQWYALCTQVAEQNYAAALLNPV